MIMGACIAEMYDSIKFISMSGYGSNCVAVNVMLLKTIYISKITKNKIIKDQLPPNRATLYNILTPRILPLLVDVAGFQ
jgi:hypothetical protein